MRITIVVSNVRGGGSTFAAVNWANAWATRGEQVSIVAVHPRDGEGSDFHRHPAIQLFREDLGDKPVANKWQAAKQLVRNLKRMREIIRQTSPDIVISFDGPVNTRTLASCLGLGYPTIVMEQVHPGQYSFGRFWERLRKLLYPKAAILVNLTNQATEWSRQRFGVTRTATIPNPVLPPTARWHPNASRRKQVVAAGRLVDQKRFDLLILAFSRIASKNPDWDLTIHGEGPNRPTLTALVAKTGGTGRINMPGWAESLSERMAEGDLFVLSSEYEGFGNVLVEAMAVGLPVVSFDCPSGPAEIIQHEVNGLLVPPLDVEAMAMALDRIMGDDAFRLRLAARAPEVLERFSLAKTLALWDACLSEAMSINRGKKRPGA